MWQGRLLHVIHPPTTVIISIFDNSTICDFKVDEIISLMGFFGNTSTCIYDEVEDTVTIALPMSAKHWAITSGGRRAMAPIVQRPTYPPNFPLTWGSYALYRGWFELFRYWAHCNTNLWQYFVLTKSAKAVFSFVILSIEEQSYYLYFYVLLWNI